MPRPNKIYTIIIGDWRSARPGERRLHHLPQSQLPRGRSVWLIQPLTSKQLQIIHGHKDRVGPSCLGLQHPRCTRRYYRSTARPSFAPLQCQGSTHCSRGSLLPVGTPPPHSQQDQQYGELGEIFVGQRNRFRWGLLGAARHVIPELSELNVCRQIELS